MVKLTLFVLLYFCVLLVNSTKYENYEPHITAVLKYLNSKPNKIYEYKKGILLNALRNKADIVELTVDVDVICILNTQYEGVPCTEQQQTCNGFVQENENDYKVLSDVTCKPKGDSSTESVDDLTTVLPFTETFNERGTNNIELSHEAVSSEQNADFVAIKADKAPCLGCPFDLNPNVEGISTLIDTALRHVECEKTQRHAAVKVIKLQQQVVAGIKYILLFEIAPTTCQKDVDLSDNNCPIDQNSSTSVCEVVFLQKPWINKLKHIIKNNCTLSQEYNIDLGKQGGSNNDDEIKINNPNSSSGSGKIDDINPEALVDLESQILPLEHEKNKPITENNSNLDIKSTTGSNQKNTSDDYYKQTDFLNKDNADGHFQETKTIQSTENVNDVDHNCDGNNLSNNSEGDIDHNEVKRSIEVEEIQQSETLLVKGKADFASSAVKDREHKKHRRDILVGAPHEIDVNNSKVLQFTNNALTRLDSMSEHPNRYKVLDIISATSQVVAGIKYSIKAKISLSDCLKNDSKLLRDCGFLQNSEIKLCDIIVWDEPWLNKSQTTLKCDDDKEYTFETSATKTKRSADPEYSGLIQNVETERNPKILEYIKTGLQHLDSKSIYETKYVINKIVKISKQVVSGRLWQITAEIGLSNCPKHDNVEQCQNVEIKESKVCQFKVWEQPWLRNEPKINILCENDTNTYVLPVDQQNSGKFDDVVVSMFEDFMVKHNKSYLNEVDFNYRLKVFNDNLKTIKLLNKYEQGTATYGVTQFSDLTRTEFSKSRGLRLDLHNENYIPFATAVTPNIKLPTEFDWRTKGAVTKVKNQESCGSCWAFSTTGNIEGQYAIKYGKLVELSEQELVDCDKLDDGCNGGLMDNAYRSIEEIGGLESESDYPYDGVDEKCHFNKTEVKVQITGALNISHNETDMAKWLVKNGPIAIAINANAMQFYVGGVSHPWKMLCSPNNLDHGVLIVGYGVHYYPLFKKTLPYWIVKNSWGSSWGEQGYYRVYRGDGTCGVNQTPSSSIVA